MMLRRFFSKSKIFAYSPPNGPLCTVAHFGGEGGNTLDAQYAIKVSVKKRHFHPVPDV